MRLTSEQILEWREFGVIPKGFSATTFHRRLADMALESAAKPVGGMPNGPYKYDCGVRGIHVSHQDYDTLLAFATAKIAELEADAGRYAWLRENVRFLTGVEYSRLMGQNFEGAFSSLDAAIDAERGGVCQK